MDSFFIVIKQVSPLNSVLVDEGSKRVEAEEHALILQIHNTQYTVSPLNSVLVDEGSKRVEAEEHALIL